MRVAREIELSARENVAGGCAVRSVQCSTADWRIGKGRTQARRVWFCENGGELSGVLMLAKWRWRSQWWCACRRQPSCLRILTCAFDGWEDSVGNSSGGSNPPHAAATSVCPLSLFGGA